MNRMMIAISEQIGALVFYTRSALEALLRVGDAERSGVVSHEAFARRRFDSIAGSLVGDAEDFSALGERRRC